MLAQATSTRTDSAFLSCMGAELFNIFFNDQPFIHYIIKKDNASKNYKIKLQGVHFQGDGDMSRSSNTGIFFFKKNRNKSFIYRLSQICPVHSATNRHSSKSIWSFD